MVRLPVHGRKQYHLCHTCLDPWLFYLAAIHHSAKLKEQTKMRMPGVEPGSQAWEACMIPLHYMRVMMWKNHSYCRHKRLALCISYKVWMLESRCSQETSKKICILHSLNCSKGFQKGNRTELSFKWGCWCCSPNKLYSGRCCGR